MKHSLTKNLYLSIFAASLIGCASGQVRITSSPTGADVSYSEDGGNKTSLGQTPLNIDAKLLSNSSAEHIQIEVSKDGYSPEVILVPTPLMPSEFSLSTQLKEVSLPKKCQDVTGQFAKLAEGIAESQSFIASKNYAMAETTLLRMSSDFPKVSVIYGLLGNVYYLRKDLKRALEFYEKALSLNPESNRTEQMVQKLRTLGVERIPAQQGGQ